MPFIHTKLLLMLSPVILAIPMFFLLMAIELIYESYSDHKTYKMNDSITNISTGTLQQLVNTFKALIKVGIYGFLYQQLSLFTLESNWLTFFYALLFWDLCYYWEHRAAHTINLFWGGHVVHHQSENYNLSVALRQTSTGFIWGTIFFLPMAILGVSPTQFVLAAGINLLYQFWIHTEHINKLPSWFEYIFNTPSHHRVHHARNPKYIDKNYAGILIIWDRLFGSFKEEEERPDYGITTPLKSWNPLYANFSHYFVVYNQVKQMQTWGDRFKVLFKSPGWMPDYLGGTQALREVDSNYQKFDINIDKTAKSYVLVQFLSAGVFNTYYFFTNAGMDWTTKSIFALWIIVTTVFIGLILESRTRWIAPFEILRLLMIPIGLYLMQYAGYAIPTWGIVVSAIFTIISLVLFWNLQRTAAHVALAKAA